MIGQTKYKHDNRPAILISNKYDQGFRMPATCIGFYATFTKDIFPILRRQSLELFP